MMRIVSKDENLLLSRFEPSSAIVTLNLMRRYPYPLLATITFSNETFMHHKVSIPATTSWTHA